MMPRIHVWHKLSTGELKKNEHGSTFNTEHIQEGETNSRIDNRRSDRIFLLLLLLLLSLLFLLLIMSILLLLSLLLERISFHFVNVHVWRGRFSMDCIKFSMFKLSLAIISPIM